MTSDPAGRSRDCVGHGTRQPSGDARPPGAARPAVLNPHPRRFFGSVRAPWPVVATRLSSVSTKLLKVRFCSRAIACSRAFSSASIRMFRFTFAMLQPTIYHVMIAA